MATSIQEFANGDTNYVAKLNANFANLAATADAAMTQGGAAIAGTVTQIPALKALFGTAFALIGVDSYKPAGASTTLNVAAGYAWLPSALKVVNGPAAALEFSGQTAGTYYTHVAADGTSSFNASPTDAAYSVAWTGAAFGAITRIAPEEDYPVGDNPAAAVQTANTVYAGPSTGAAALPAFRALVAEDIPALARPYDVGAFFPGKPTASQLVCLHVFNRAVTFAASLAGSHGVAGAAATASAAFDVQKNGSSIGTMAFAGSATTATFSGAGGSFAAGDVLSVYAPGTPDATLSDISFTLDGTR